VEGSALLDGVRAAVKDVIRVGTSGLRIGVVYKDTPYWAWAIGVGGDLIWQLTLDGFNAGLDSGDLAQVDAVLFEEGAAPGKEAQVWNQEGIRVIVWMSQNHRQAPIKRGWKTRSERMSHLAIGGVTSAEVTFRIAMRMTRAVPNPDWELGSVVGIEGGTLRRILGSITPGKECVENVGGLVLSSSGILDLKNRERLYSVPSVFSKTGFVKRQLTPKEILSALDVPASITKGASIVELETWAKEKRPIPFKLRCELLRSLGDWFGKQDQVTLPGRVPIKRDLKTTAEVELDAKRSRPVVEEVSLGELKSASKGLEDSTDQVRTEEAVSGEAKLAPDMFEEATDRNLKAVKSDKAKIPTHLWDDRIKAGLVRMNTQVRDEDLALLLRKLRRLSHKYWVQIVDISFWDWWRDDVLQRELAGLPPCARSLEAGMAALRHSQLSTWWEWPGGSAPFFWRLPKEWQEDFRDGLKPRFTGPPPSDRTPQRKDKDPEVVRKQREKLVDVRSKGYIALFIGILSLTSFFSVPKGEDDIRMVYDGTKSGLNRVLFAPWFALATVDSMLRSVGPGTWSADNDFGEMFLNFWLHPDLQKYTGVDITALFPEELRGDKIAVWEAWTRCAMGLTTSPYTTVQCAKRIKFLVLGESEDEDNVFRWETVRVNLPGDPDYDPALPWVSKVRKDGELAADVHDYVDDYRETAGTEEDAWAASSRVAKKIAYYGCQDAMRKRRAPDLFPGAWAGSVIDATGGSVHKMVSKERWEKVRKHVTNLKTWSNQSNIPHKELEKVRGFLVYVSLTYTGMVPYLKGIHLTLDSWRNNRDDDGWKLTSSSDEYVESKFMVFEEEIPPPTVQPMPRLAQDVEALEELTRSIEPPRVRVRPDSGCLAAFLYGDASGEGFGTSLWYTGSTGVDTEYGEWTKEFSSQSSNEREMYNLVLKIEEMFREGGLHKGIELFVFTDNVVTERAFYRGSSKSRRLFELVLRLKKLEMEGALFLRIIWVAGTRMIAQGTDGLSRGDLSNGVMAGESMLSFVPLNKSALDRSPELGDWFLSSTGGIASWSVLTPKDWFKTPHQGGNCVWYPPPAAADVALEQLCEAKHIRPHGAHIFIVPALMSMCWRKKLGKIADFVFSVPVGSGLWGKKQHEPLIVGLICPFLSCRPWQVRFCSRELAGLKGELQGVWPGDMSHARNSLRKFWAFAWERADL
jgi:hypothetical protein